MYNLKVIYTHTQAHTQVQAVARGLCEDYKFRNKAFTFNESELQYSTWLMWWLSRQFTEEFENWALGKMPSLDSKMPT